MSDYSPSPVRSEHPRFGSVLRAMRTGLSAWMQRASEVLLCRRHPSAAVAATATEETLEQLHDLRWQIADNARRYRDLLDAQAGLIVRRDATGRVLFANRAYLQTFGFADGELAGRLHEPHVLAVEPQAPKIIENIETVMGPRWIAWEETVCGGEVQRTGRDITQERADAEALRQARDAALEASRAKSRFLANMSHEIRTPMNGILGMSDLLLDGRLSKDQATYAKAISQSARALMSLIDEILDFSRIEAGKLVLTSAPFSVAETVENCIALLEPKAADKGIDLSFAFEGEPPPLLSGDEPRVRQIVLNLLSNAVKFTDSGGVRVTLSARDHEPGTSLVRLSIAVEDTGIGLTEAECASVFAEFERAEAAVRRQDGGSGLGLAIAQRIAQAMQGQITVRSQPERGSVFKAELVIERAESTAAVERASLVSQPLQPKPDRQTVARVLLAEDNAVNALLATRLLELQGYAVDRVHTGDEAVAAIARTISGQAAPYDLVLMDIYMPRLDGIEATRAIRRLTAASGRDDRPSLPIIAVTANAFPEDRQRYLTAGMDDYLAKPFDGRALSAVLSRWLTGGRRENPAA